MTTPNGYDPETFKPPLCPACATPVDIDWLAVHTWGDTQPTWRPSRVTCPTSEFHDVSAAYAAIALVGIIHADTAVEGSVPRCTLDQWREQGWRPVDQQHQTPTEVVEARVDALRKRVEHAQPGE